MKVLIRFRDDPRPTVGPTEIEGELVYCRVGDFDRYMVVRRKSGKLFMIEEGAIYSIEFLEAAPEWLVRPYDDGYLENTIKLHEKMTERQSELGLDD